MEPGPRRIAFVAFVLAAICVSALVLLLEPMIAVGPQALAAAPQMPTLQDPRMQKAYAFKKDGWTFVHLEGPPEQIGFQHGYLLSREIADAFEAVKLEDTHTTGRDWQFFRLAHNSHLG